MSQPVVVANGAARPSLPRPWLLLLLVLVVTLGSYVRVLGADFVWDDHKLIERAPEVQQLQPLGSYFERGFWLAKSAEFDPGRVYYRPLVTLSFALDQRLYAGNPGGFHLSNVLLHLVVCVLLFRLCCQYGARPAIAVLGVALWALQPRLTEDVAWVAGRTDVLATLFVLAALLVRARPGPSGRIASGVCLLLGLLCKEVALAGVVAVWVAELLAPGSARARALRLLPGLLALGVYVVLRARAVGVVPPEPRSLSWHLLVTTAAVGHYALMLLTPWRPNLQIGRLAQPGVGFSVFGCLVLLAIGFWLLRRGRHFSLRVWAPAALLAVSLGLVLHVVRINVNVIAADRFLYLPLAGLTLILTPAVSALAPATWLALPGIAAALLLGGLSYARCAMWSNELALWTRAFVETRQNQLLSCVELGRMYANVGLLSESLTVVRGCAANVSDRALVNIGSTVLIRQGHYQEALRLLDGASDKYRASAYYRLTVAQLRLALADFPAARMQTERSLQADPENAEARALAASLPALEALRRALDANPGMPHVERARGYRRVGMIHEALAEWRAAPASELPAAEFATALRFAIEQGDARTAREFHERFVALFPDHSDHDVAAVEGTFQSRQLAVGRLRAAWPKLGLPLRESP